MTTALSHLTDEANVQLAETMANTLSGCYADDVRDTIKYFSEDSFDSVYPRLASSLTDEELMELSDYLRDEVTWSIKVTPIFG